MEKSQLGFIKPMEDRRGNYNILHFGSGLFVPVTRCVMASEIHALVLGFDAALSIQHLIGEINGINPPIEAYDDSNTVFDVTDKLGHTSEKRLKIDISDL